MSNKDLICDELQEVVGPSRCGAAYYRLKLAPMAAGGAQHHETRGLISMRDLLDQVETNKKHFMRSSQSVPELPATPVASGSPLAFSVPTHLPPVRELDNDPDTFMLLCLPIPLITLLGLRRRICRCISNLLWTRPPLPCVTTTCGPIHHVRSCEFHPLSRSGSLPYKMPIRRSPSLLSIKVQRSKSLPENLHSSSSVLAASSSASPSASSAASSAISSSASSSVGS